MNIRRASALAGSGWWLLLSAVACAEMSAQLTAEKATLFIHEPFTLRLEVQSEAPPEPPRLPAVPDLAVTAIRRLPADPAQRKHAFQIELISERDGMLTIPPFPVSAEGETTLTLPLRLRISKPRSATEMTLELAVEPTRLRIGQAATVTVTWTSRVSFQRCKQLLFEIPLLADQRCHVFPLTPQVPESEQIGLPVNNIRVVAQAEELEDGRRSLVLRYKLVPHRPGVLRARPARLLCALLDEEPKLGDSPGYFYNHFFESPGTRESYEELYLAAAVPEITVRDLAAAGRTSRFAEIVGPCTLRTSVIPSRLAVRQPALFTVHLEDLTFARHVNGLPSSAFDGLRADFQFSAEQIRESASDHSRSFTYILRPMRAAIRRIPAVVIQAFDPATDSYLTLRSEPIPITVESAAGDAAAAFSPRLDAATPIPLPGVRQNRRGERVMIVVQGILEWLGRLWWVFVLLPALIWLALRPLAKQWERCRQDPVFARARSAWPRYRRTARLDAELAWRTYLADRLDLCADALTANRVSEALRSRQVEAHLIAEVRRRFEEQDAVDYGRSPTGPAADIHSLVRRLQKATVPLLVLLGLWLPQLAAAGNVADTVFVQAMRMREDKPDEAQPLFVDAALRYESHARFLNAANSWFFAGESGRALVNYRAAERRSPFNRQVRESIEFLRSNRADAFPPPAAPTGILAAWWDRYCNWSPLLRVGSCVCAYLVAWMVFITSQLSGRRVRRAVWILLVAAIFVPLVSLAETSLRHDEGVVVIDSVARLGPGYAYDAAFREPLHQATEFKWLETRQGWVHCRLPDDSEGWLPESGCMKVP